MFSDPGDVGLPENKLCELLHLFPGLKTVIVEPVFGPWDKGMSIRLVKQVEGAMARSGRTGIHEMNMFV